MKPIDPKKRQGPRMPKISDETLDAAESTASTPTKKLNGFTTDVFNAVAHFRAGKTAGLPLNEFWPALRGVLDAAAEAGDWTAFDDLGKALQRVEVETIQVTITEHQGGDATVIRTAIGELTNPPRQPKTITLIHAIRQLQSKAGRAPTRQEIIDKVSVLDPDGMDETELSRQLKNLGWQDLI